MGFREAFRCIDNPLDRWIAIIVIIFLVCGSFLWGVDSSSRSYESRYPVVYSWWADHEQLHYPGVLISAAIPNTSCRQKGNVHPPVGDDIVQIQWLGGRDSGFVGNFKVISEDSEFIVPTPQPGECLYIYNSTGNIVVYGQDITSGGWIKLGSGSGSSYQT